MRLQWTCPDGEADPPINGYLMSHFVSVRLQWSCIKSGKQWAKSLVLKITSCYITPCGWDCNNQVLQEKQWTRSLVLKTTSYDVTYWGWDCNDQVPREKQWARSLVLKTTSYDVTSWGWDCKDQISREKQWGRYLVSRQRPMMLHPGAEISMIKSWWRTLYTRHRLMMSLYRDETAMMNSHGRSSEPDHLQSRHRPISIMLQPGDEITMIASRGETVTKITCDHYINLWFLIITVVMWLHTLIKSRGRRSLVIKTSFGVTSILGMRLQWS